LTFEPFGSLGISLAICMLAAISLDNQVMLGAREVDDERANGVLAPELEPYQTPAAQCRPEATLGIWGGLTKPAGNAIGHAGNLTASITDSTSIDLRHAPSPTAGVARGTLSRTCLSRLSAKGTGGRRFGETPKARGEGH